MSSDTQALIALAVVLVTFGLFIWGKARKKSGGCGGGCGCDHTAHDHSGHEHDPH